MTTQFLKMETLLDDSVGQNVELEFERGGTPLTVQLAVSDKFNIFFYIVFCSRILLQAAICFPYIFSSG